MELKDKLSPVLATLLKYEKNWTLEIAKIA